MLNFLKNNYILITISLVFLLALVLRIGLISEIPPGLYPDEALNGNQAQESLDSGHLKIFYQENNGRGGIYIWLIALSFKILGMGLWQLKLPGILAGSFTAILSYFLSLAIFERTKYKAYSKKIGLVSSFLIATSFWSVDISRLAFSAVLIPPLLMLGVIFLFKADKKETVSKKYILFSLSAVFFSLSLYSYPASRVAPLIFIFFFLWLIIPKFKSYAFFKKIKEMAFFLLIFLIASAPILFILFSSVGNERVNELSVFSSQHPISEILNNTIITLGEFNVSGDCNQRHNNVCQPELFWPIGIFFIFGIFIAFKNIRNIQFAFLLFWFFIMLLPAIFTNEGLPHALRSIGSLPPVFILASLAAVIIYENSIKKIDSWIKLYEKYRRQLFRIKKEFIVLAFSIIMFSAYMPMHAYFLEWPENPLTTKAFDSDIYEISNNIKNLRSEKIYIIANTNGVWVNDVPIQAEIVRFFNYRNNNIKYLREDGLSSLELNYGDLIIPLKNDKSLEDLIFKDFLNIKKEGVNGMLYYSK